MDSSSGECRSSSGAVLSEPSNVEANTDESWNEEDQSDEWLPPWNGGVHKLEVSSKELNESDESNNQSNENNTGFDWEAEAALCSNSQDIGAVAEAAAALGSNFFSVHSVV